MPDYYGYDNWWMGTTSGQSTQLTQSAWTTWTGGTTQTTPSLTQSAWYEWTGAGTTQTTQTTSYDVSSLAASVWQQWQVTAAARTTIQNRRHTTPSPRPSPASPRDLLIRRNRNRAANLRRRVASRRARELLMANLNDTQREEYASKREFHVETADGTRRYRIQEGVAGNVYFLGQAGRATMRYCCHLRDPEIPACDHMLIQKLMLETDEERFLELANASPVGYVRA
jgi:hypothetical protein